MDQTNQVSIISNRCTLCFDDVFPEQTEHANPMTPSSNELLLPCGHAVHINCLHGWERTNPKITECFYRCKEPVVRAWIPEAPPIPLRERLVTAYNSGVWGSVRFRALLPMSFVFTALSAVEFAVPGSLMPTDIFLLIPIETGIANVIVTVAMAAMGYLGATTIRNLREGVLESFLGTVSCLSRFILGSFVGTIFLVHFSPQSSYADYKVQVSLMSCAILISGSLLPHLTPLGVRILNALNQTRIIRHVEGGFTALGALAMHCLEKIANAAVAYKNHLINDANNTPKPIYRVIVGTSAALSIASTYALVARGE